MSYPRLMFVLLLAISWGLHLWTPSRPARVVSVPSLLRPATSPVSPPALQAPGHGVARDPFRPLKGGRS